MVAGALMEERLLGVRDEMGFERNADLMNDNGEAAPLLRGSWFIEEWEGFTGAKSHPVNFERELIDMKDEKSVKRKRRSW
jgi:hypothetical protein